MKGCIYLQRNRLKLGGDGGGGRGGKFKIFGC